MTALDEIRQFGRALLPARSAPAMEVQRFQPSFQNWVDSYLSFQGGLYQPYSTTWTSEKAEQVSDTFSGYVQSAYKANGIVFAVSMARARPFSEMTFKFRRYGQAGGGNDLFGTQALAKLENPWPGGTTQSLLLRAEQDVTCGGTFFVADEGDRLRRLRPDWVEFILTAPPAEAVESDIIGFKYTVGGARSGGPSRLYTLDECAHWAPIPDPDALYRGMSWLTPVINEMQADGLATAHKRKFFENAATPNLAVSLKESVTPEQFQTFVRQANEASVGVANAYKTMYLGGGADVTVIGADLHQLDFRNVQGAGETRIAASGGVPPIVVGLSEGLQAATYSNYGQARRAFGDQFLRSQWRSICGSLAAIVDVPADATLWYSGADVAFLREDIKDLAEVQSINAATIGGLISAGFTPQSAVDAVMAEDMTLLVHTGLVSVQLQPPGTTAEEPEAPAEIEPAEDAPTTEPKGGPIP